MYGLALQQSGPRWHLLLLRQHPAARQLLHLPLQSSLSSFGRRFAAAASARAAAHHRPQCSHVAFSGVAAAAVGVLVRRQRAAAIGAAQQKLLPVRQELAAATAVYWCYHRRHCFPFGLQAAEEAAVLQGDKEAVIFLARGR